MMRVVLLFLLSVSVLRATSLRDLSLDEKIGQLLMVAAVSNSACSESMKLFTKGCYRMEPSYVASLVQDYHVGGIIFLGKAFEPNRARGFIAEQVAVTNYLQSLSKKIPLFIALDAEWGLGMRLEDGMAFPHAMTLGALAPEHDDLIERIACRIGHDCARHGVHINFAPVVDVNTNVNNPVINCRSFGQDPHIVARKAAAYARGLSYANVMSCAKHFPGHGDTTVDSHLGLPFIEHDLQRLHEVELLPFKSMISAQIPSIMIAHVIVPSLMHGSRDDIATVSHDIVTKLLRDDMGFSGLIFTDGLGMKAVTQRYGAGEVAVKALKAGVDILVCPVDVPQTVDAIKQAIRDGVLTEAEIDEKVVRILAAKEKYCCVQEDVAFGDEEILRRDAYQAAITRLRGNTVITSSMRSACIVPAQYVNSPFMQTILKSRTIDVYIFEQLCDEDVAKINGADCVMIPLFLTERYHAGLAAQRYESPLIQKISAKKIFILFGCPYYYREIQHDGEWIIAYEPAYDAQYAAADIILGNSVEQGILPVQCVETFVSCCQRDCPL